jgi:hypothetical protein
MTKQKLDRVAANIWRLAALFYPNIKVPKLPTEVR